MRRFPSPSVVSTGALSHMLDQPQHVPVDDAAGDRFEQSAHVRDGVEILAQIGVDHIGVALAKQAGAPP
jgi:hypothetical protein